MKINNSSPQPAITRVQTDRAGKAGDKKAAHTHGTATSVHVSDTSKKLAAARAPEVPDEARIERLRGLVQSGKLHVDAGAIADAMLREER